MTSFVTMAQHNALAAEVKELKTSTDRRFIRLENNLMKVVADLQNSLDKATEVQSETLKLVRVLARGKK